MNKLTGPDVLIKVDIAEGRGFDLENGDLLLVRGMIQDQAITAELPDARMVWETDKISLRRLRSANVPVRLDVFRIRCEETSGTRIGQLLLNLKEAPLCEVWRKLIRVHEPGEGARELCVSLDFDNMEKKCGENEEFELGKDDWKPRLRDECGVYEIGPEDGNRKDFRVTMHVNSISNIDQLVSPKVHLVSLIYQVLGEQVETEPKVLGSGDSERSFLPIGETVCVSLRASPEYLQHFLAKQSLMHVQLWQLEEDHTLARQLAEASVLIGDQTPGPWQVTVTPSLGNNNCKLVVTACLEQQETSSSLSLPAWTYRQLHLHHLVLHQSPPNRKCFLTLVQAGTPVMNRIALDVASPNEVSTLGYKVRLEPGDIPELTLNSEDGKLLAQTSLSQVTDSGISTATLVETSSGLAAGVLSFETGRDFQDNSMSDMDSGSDSFTSLYKWKSEMDLKNKSISLDDSTIIQLYPNSSISNTISQLPPSRLNLERYSMQHEFKCLDFYTNGSDAKTKLNIHQDTKEFLDPILTSKLRRACEQSIALAYILQQNSMRCRVKLKMLSDREKELDLACSEHLNATDLELKVDAAYEELNDIKFQTNGAFNLWRRQASLAMAENQRLRQELDQNRKELHELRKVTLSGKHITDLLNTMKSLEIRLESALKAKQFFKEQFNRSSQEVFVLRKAKSIARDITLQLDKEENQAIANYYQIEKCIQDIHKKGGNRTKNAVNEAYSRLENIRNQLDSILSRRGELLRITSPRVPPHLEDIFSEARKHLANAVAERQQKRNIELKKGWPPQLILSRGQSLCLI